MRNVAHTKWLAVTGFLLVFLSACGGNAPGLPQFFNPTSNGGTQSNHQGGEGDSDPGDSDGGTIAGSGSSGGDGGTVDLRTPPNLVVTPGNYDFQIQSVGSLTHKSFTVQNVGQKPAENIRAEGLSAPYSFREGNYPGFRGTCGTRLLGGASCQIFLTFHPVALGRFQQSSFVLRWDTSGSVNVPLDGMATNITTLRFNNLVDDNTFFDFGVVAFGSTVTKTIHVNYYGTRPASGVSFSGIAPPLSIQSSTCGDTVTADCDLVIAFTSIGPGSTNQRLKMTYDNTSYAAEDNHNILATGSSQVTPAVLTVSAVNFGRILVNTSKDLTVTLVKSGTLPATGVAPRSFGSPYFSFKGGNFPGAGGTCASTITANCTLVLSYAPTTTGNHSDSLRLDYHNGNTAALMTTTLGGQSGTPAVLTMSPATAYDYGSFPLGYIQDANFTVSNSAQSIAATSLVITGLTLPFSHISGCTGTLSPGAACTLRLRFRPTAVGTFNANFTVSYFDGVTTRNDLTNSLSGTGTNGAQLFANTSTYDFGSVIIGNTATATFTLTYYGGRPASNLLITGIDGVFAFPGGDFSGGGTCTGTISASCTFRVSFTPTVAMLYTTTLSLQYDDGDGQARTVSISLRGTGVNANAAVLAFNPATIDFGNVAVNSPTNVTITVQRTGNLSATSLAASGLSGSLSFNGGSYPGTGGSCGTTLSGASCTLVLRYLPTAAETLSQTLTLTYFNGMSAASVSVSLTGNAVPVATLSFAGIGLFGSMPIGNMVSRTLTLSNSGIGAAAAMNITVPPAYSVASTDCGTSLPPAGSCALTVQFSTSTPGQYNGNISVAYQNGLGATSASHALTGRATVSVLLAVNGNHTCARNEIGQLKCWGQNNYGQLGLGDTVNRGASAGTMGANLPAVSLGAGRYPKEIALGYWHTCAILDNDDLKCWGQNQYGQLGLGSSQTTVGTSPSHMGDNLAAVSLGSGVKATKISLGYSHSCALLDNGRVKCWGQNAEGQLGLGDTVDRGLSSSDMGNSLSEVDLGGPRVIELSVNTSHSCALLENHGVKCWGNNFFGQLGVGDFANRGVNPNEMGNHLPNVNLGSGAEVQSIAAGGAFTCALLADGQVKCWGRNESGILGQVYCQNADGDFGLCGDPNYPLTLRGLGILPEHMGSALNSISLGTGVTATHLSVGNSHACVQLANGSTKCWGENQYGQLGLGNTTSRGLGGDMGELLTPVSLGTGTIQQVISGNLENCALFTTEQIKCWGNNRFGGLGYGDTNHRGDEGGEMGNALPFVSY